MYKYELKMWNNSRGFTVEGGEMAIREVVTMVASGLQVSNTITIHVADKLRGTAAEATFECLPKNHASIMDWMFYIVQAKQHGDA